LIKEYAPAPSKYANKYYELYEKYMKPIGQDQDWDTLDVGTKNPNFERWN
jgi:hypothetical protein